MNAKLDYIVKFIAWVFPDRSDSVYKELLITDISVGITAELAEKSGKFDDTNYCCVYIAPEIFQKSIITKTGLNHTAQTVDVLRLLEDWEASGFSLYIDKMVFHLGDTK